MEGLCEQSLAWKGGLILANAQVKKDRKGFGGVRGFYITPKVRGFRAQIHNLNRIWDLKP